jgi:predicted exporter
MMNLDNLTAYDLPTGVLALAGIILLALVFRTGKVLLKLAVFLLAIEALAGAVWWHLHQQ